MEAASGENRASRGWAVLIRLLFLVLLSMLGMSCGSDGPPPASTEGPSSTKSKALEDDRIPIEVLVNEEWHVVHPRASAVEDVARGVCLARNDDDDPVCLDLLPATALPFDVNVTELPGSTGTTNCITAVCAQRAENCAGFLMLETAEAPRQLELPYEIQLESLEILSSDWEGIDSRQSPTAVVGAIRFQPLAGSGRAAALRASLRHFAESARIARLIQSEESGGERCWDRFSGADSPRGLGLDPDDLPYKWEDLYLMAFNDAVHSYATTAETTMEAMVDAADLQLKGTDVQFEESKAQWLGTFDSRNAAARLIGTGMAQLTDEVPEQNACGAGTQSPTATDGAVCPSITGNPGVSKAISLVRTMGISPQPDAYSGQDLEVVLFQAVVEDRTDAELNTDFTPQEWMLSEGITSADVELAKRYLCAEATLNQTTFTPNGKGTIIPRYYGTTEPTFLPPAVVASQFLTSFNGDDAVEVDSDAYAEGGVVRTLDQMAQTAKRIRDDIGEEELVKAGNMLATQGLIDMIRVDVGGSRLEMFVGTESGGVIDQVKIGLHQASENRHLLVQGEDGMKCVTTGKIDGAPCDQYDYRIDFFAAATVQNSPEDMTDIAEQSPYLVLTSFPQPGNLTTPIASGRTIYVIEEVEGVRRVLVGAIPTVGSATITGGFTRRIVMPYGGTLQNRLADMIRPSGSDCAIPETTCAGLPASIWPPLDSEINGEQTDLPYERNWKFWLEAAKEAAAEADRRGEDLIAHGLQMDREAQSASDATLAACGEAAINGEGCAAPEEATWVSFGDTDLCLWSVDGQMCYCPDEEDCPPCPLRRDGEDCSTAVPGAFETPPTSLLTYEITDTFNLGTSAVPPTDRVCEAFARLRTGDLGDYEGTRSDYIRDNIISNFDQDEIQRIAEQLEYHEDFADNYRLLFGGRTVFDTNRTTRPCYNSEVGAPCNNGPVDTGSAYWGSTISCFQSGLNCPASSSEPFVDGLDGCPDDDRATGANLTYDTEKDALRRRWAWGFGHLRRSVAVLGVLSGELNGMMHLPRVLQNLEYSLGPGRMVTQDAAGGDACTPGSNDSDKPPWLYFCPVGKKDHKEETRCVVAGQFGGVGSDTFRLKSGRPVNVNAFIANRVMRYNGGGCLTIPGPFNWSQSVGLFDFPPAGVDPQMVYCDMPNPHSYDLADTATWHNSQMYRTISWGGDVEGSGWIGASFALPATFNPEKTEWVEAQSRIWEVPSGNFCDMGNEEFDGDTSAVWRAFCAQPLSGTPNDADVDNTLLMTEGKVGQGQVKGVYVDASTISTWLDSSNKEYAQFLFDLRAGQIDGTTPVAPFQYALDRRNIYDALELACHAKYAATDEIPSCPDVDDDYVPTETSVETIESILSCYESRMRARAGQYVVGPIPRPVIDAFVSGRPISTTSGYGGSYLELMVEQYEAIDGIHREFDHMSDAMQRLSSLVQQVRLLQQKQDAEKKELEYRTMSSSLSAWAGAMAQLASSLNVSWQSSASNTVGQVAAGMMAQAARLNDIAMKFGSEAAEAGWQLEMLQLMQQLVDVMSSAQEYVENVSLHMNRLTDASAKLSTLRAQVERESSRMVFADYAGEDGQDPQFLNTAMRRVYNTRLIRYRAALQRAKKTAFLARRAIELRFGVDLSQMDEDMTLVEPPRSWANDVCGMQGIDYSQIRSADEENPIDSMTWEEPPEGDDFANAYIGDYVTLLEDFVRSYSIDKPLQDGDDIAVLSLGEDILGVFGQCVEDADNLLYFSTDLNQQLETEDETVGWYVSDCGYDIVDDDEETSPWRGCLEVSMWHPGLADASTDWTTGLPSGAIAYEVVNKPCAVVDPDAGTGTDAYCPDGVTSYESVGAVTQRFHTETSGQHRVSAYFRERTASQSVALEVVRVDDSGAEESVATEIFVAPSTWGQGELYFDALPDQDYLLKIHPSATETTLGSDYANWPKVLIAAAQVEWVQTETDGSPAPGKPWQYTDGRRNLLNPVCHTTPGPALRRAFGPMKCEYVCSDGIGTCSAEDVDAYGKQCFYDIPFTISLDQIEAGVQIPSGQIARGNFNFRHYLAGVNLVGTTVTDCENVQGASCYNNGFVEYSLLHEGNVEIRNWDGGVLKADMDTARIEHGKGLAVERTVTNPPSSADMQLLEPYLKGELKGRPIQGAYTLRIWDSPSLRWDHVEDIQLVWKYHYWTRFSK